MTSYFTADTKKNRLIGSGGRQAALKVASKKGKKVVGVSLARSIVL